MKIPEIKRLAEGHTLKELEAMAHCLENEIQHDLNLHQYIDGADDGERLTNVLGAMWILQQMQANGTLLPAELRRFSQKVRTSIEQ